MSAQVYEVVAAGSRRVVRLAGRPELRAPLAHPTRCVDPGRVAKPVACAGVSPSAVVRGWLAVKLAAVGLLTMAGAAAAVHGFIAFAEPEWPEGYVAGDPAWEHLEQP